MSKTKRMPKQFGKTAFLQKTKDFSSAKYTLTYSITKYDNKETRKHAMLQKIEPQKDGYKTIMHYIGIENKTQQKKHCLLNTNTKRSLKYVIEKTLRQISHTHVHTQIQYCNIIAIALPFPLAKKSNRKHKEIKVAKITLKRVKQQ